MAPSLIIGLVAQKGAGKDTFADAAVRASNRISKTSFAEPIKAACRAIFLLEEDDLECRVKKEAMDERWGITRRAMMQVLGTECVRANFGSQHWIEHMRFRLDAMEAGEAEVAIVTDVRFTNEAEFLRAYGCRAVIVKIERPCLTGSQDAHASETSVSHIPCDTIVLNDGSAHDLQDKAIDLLRRLCPGAFVSS
jgi:hypothetical protein